MLTGFDLPSHVDEAVCEKAKVITAPGGFGQGFRFEGALFHFGGRAREESQRTENRAQNKSDDDSGQDEAKECEAACLDGEVFEGLYDLRNGEAENDFPASFRGCIPVEDTVISIFGCKRHSTWLGNDVRSAGQLGDFHPILDLERLFCSSFLSQFFYIGGKRCRVRIRASGKSSRDSLDKLAANRYLLGLLLHIGLLVWMRNQLSTCTDKKCIGGLNARWEL